MDFEYNQKNELGFGKYAVVFNGKWQGKPVAVKRILLGNLDTNREESSMMGLVHDNVVKLLAVREDASFKFLILELCCATVQDYCNSSYQGPAPPTDYVALYQMADGLAYIHSRKLVHRDISTGNVMIGYGDDHQSTVMKISDFGFCKSATETGSYSVSGLAGTIRFIAPELQNLEITETGKPRAKNTSDIFSMGCLFYVFLTRGSHPFSDGSTLLIPMNILGNRYFLDGLDIKYQDVKVVIEKMIQRDPVQRMPLELVKDHLRPFLI